MKTISQNEQPLIFCLFDVSPFLNIHTLNMGQYNILIAYINNNQKLPRFSFYKFLN